jgi:F-type H+-transporting ATPase subunit a
LAIMSIVLVEGAGIYQRGVKKWLHKFTEPIAIGKVAIKDYII